MVKRLGEKKIIFGILVTLILLTAGGINYAGGIDGPKVRELSLQEAVYLAVKNNPEIELADLAVKKAQNEYDGASDVAYKLEYDYVQTHQIGVIKWVNPKATEVALALAKKRQELAEKTLRLNVETAYYNVLKAERNLAIKREGLKYFQDQSKIALTAFKIGTKAKVDVTIAESAVAGYQAQVTNEENNYRIAVMELNRITGLDLDTPLKLTTKLSIEKIGSTIKLDETIKKALVDNIEILSVKKNLELAEVKYDVAKKFGLSAYDTTGIEKKIAEANVRKQELATTAVVKQSYLSLFSMERMIEWQTKEVEKAAENARVFLLRYNAGLATSLEAKKATIDLEQAEENLAETIYKYNLLKSQFKYELFSTSSGSS